MRSDIGYVQYGGGGIKYLRNVLWKVSFRTGKRFIMDQTKEVVGVVNGGFFSVLWVLCNKLYFFSEVVIR